jgi:MFS family permease
MSREEKKVILASSAGTIFEWYDFYLYGSLAAIIGAQFFTPSPRPRATSSRFLAFARDSWCVPSARWCSVCWATSSAGKYTFLMTILIMGISTFLVGLLPNYNAWGAAAPILLIILRMAQGLALGGEYGGAAIYVAEHAPQGRRGYYTAFIQTTATLGLLLSLLVILAVTSLVNNNWDPVPILDAAGAPVLDAAGNPTTRTAFQDWGWRIPFLLSIFLLGISLYIRLQMNESPAFKKMKEEGTASKAPLREAFGNWKNGKFAIIALFGLVPGRPWSGTRASSTRCSSSRTSSRWTSSRPTSSWPGR